MFFILSSPNKQIGFLSISTYEPLLSQLSVKFSYPFLNAGMGILVKLPQRFSNQLLSSVFEWDLWLYIGLSYLVYGILLYFAEKENNHYFGENKNAHTHHIKRNKFIHAIEPFTRSSLITCRYLIIMI